MVATIPTEQLSTVVIRFAGDSGDGMQLAGSQFTLSSAVAGNDLATLPDFPAEIRAPAGTLYGVSGFQLQIGSDSTRTPGDRPDVLVAMNPAALKVNLPSLPEGGVIIADSDGFSKRNLKLVDYAENPLEDDSLTDYQVHVVPMTTLTVNALEELGLPSKAAKRCTNFFALGLTYWLYSRPLEPTLSYLEQKFAKKPEVLEANRRALKAGYHYGETAEGFVVRYEVPRATIAPGTYRTVNGNEAIAMGLVTAARKAGLDLTYAGYPITPASSLLEALAGWKHLGVRTLQAEDEIAAAGFALGASYGGALGATGTSGPGICLKSEFIGLALSAELPLVICDIQRGGPSTGLPTKTEQSDLLLAAFGRHGDAPIPVVAARSPAEAFDAAIEACRLALHAMTPVMLLSDGSIANGTEPWLLPDPDDIPALSHHRVTERGDGEGAFKPFTRDMDSLARPWAVPGTAGFEHRIGGIEKAHETGNISYDPDNHELMTRLRREKVERLADLYPPTEVDGPREGDLAVVAWGGTYGAVASAVQQCQDDGLSVAHIHLRNLNPLPNDLADILRSYRRVLVPEINEGQLRMILRAQLLVDAQGFNRVRGQPFSVGELVTAIREHTGGVA